MKLRFLIRDIFWLSLVAALVTGWSMDHWTHTSSRMEEVVNRAQELLNQNQALIQTLRARNSVLAQQRDAALFHPEHAVAYNVIEQGMRVDAAEGRAKLIERSQASREAK